MPNLMSQRGVSLVELILASTLGLVFLLGIIMIFLSHKQTYRYHYGLMTIQENGRITTQLLNRELREAGQIACGKLSQPVKIFSQHPNIVFDATHAVNQGIPGTLKNRIKPNTDAIQIQKMSATTASLMAAMRNKKNMTATKTPRLKFKPDDFLIITDCEQGELFQIESVFFSDKHQEITAKKSLQQSYKLPAELGYFINRYYYVADTGRKNDREQPVYALYSSDEMGHEMELIDGVESMKIQTANNIIQIELTLTSIEEILDKPQPSYTDKQFRSRWLIEIALRSKIV